MKKRNSLIASFLTLLLVNLVSAYSPYGSFSIRNFLYRIDPMTMTLAIAFFVVFAVAYFALIKFIRNKYKEPNVMISAVIAFCIALFTVYWINLNGLDLASIFYRIGFSSDILGIILPFVILIIAIILIARFKFHGFLFIFGVLLIGVTTFFEDLIYEKGIALTIGVVMVLWGWMLRRRNAGKGIGGSSIMGAGRKLRYYSDARNRLARRQEIRQNWDERRAAKREISRRTQTGWFNAGRKIGRGIGRVKYGKIPKTPKGKDPTGGLKI